MTTMDQGGQILTFNKMWTSNNPGLSMAEITEAILVAS